MENFFVRKGLAVVADLVVYPPASLLVEPNLGRKSVADTREILRRNFEMSWETLQRLVGGAAAAESAIARPQTPAEEWNNLAATLSLEAAQRPLAMVDLPARMLTHARRLGAQTVAELVAVPFDELSEARAVGALTLRATLDALLRLRVKLAVAEGTPGSELEPAPAPSDPLPAGSHWRALLQHVFRELPAKERLVVTQRAGLAGPALTLKEVGECLGFSRERARQLEEKAIERVRAERWFEPARERLEAACPDAMKLVADIDDELFAFVDDEEEALIFFVNSVLEGPVRLLRFEETSFASRLRPAEVDALVAALRDSARNLPFPFPVAEKLARLSVAAGKDASLVKVVLPLLAPEWIDDGDETRGFGGSTQDAVLAWVRALGRPVRRAELDEKFGRRMPPDALVSFDRGLFALPEQIPDWDRWRLRAPALVKAILEELGPDRQWPTKELLGPIAERAEVPAWFNEWTLGSLLRDGKEVRYLGRNVVALPEAGEERLQIHELAEQRLAGAGGPVDEDVFVGWMAKTRGFSRNAWNGVRMRRPFLLLGDGRIGIAPRDLGTSEETAAAFSDEVFRTLDQRQRGLGTADIADLARRFAPWDRKLSRSILRLDGRFRFTQGGAVGLAEWEDVRVPTQGDVLEELLAQNEGRVPVRLAMERVPTASGEPLSRERIGLLANSIRARLAGDVIEWMQVDERESRLSGVVASVVAAIPEVSVSPFLAHLDAPKSLDDLRSGKAAWLARMREESRAPSTSVNAEQVERLAAVADELLGLFEMSADPERRAVCSAAVQYLSSFDDGVSDFLLGGLDDDEHVLSAVRREL